MKIVVTGSNGFIGKNLLATLAYKTNIEIETITRNSTLEELARKVQASDLILHLAGESRSRENSNAFLNNIRYTEQIIKYADKKKRIIFASTNKQNHLAYWQAKQTEEQLIKNHFSNHTIVRMDNVFGKWAKPFYNSVVATFLQGTIEAKPFQLFDELTPIDFLYIDEVVERMIELIHQPTSPSLLVWKGTFQIHAKGLLDMVQSIHQDYQSGQFLIYKDAFKQRLALTYLTYLPENQLILKPTQYPDARGNFIELTKNEMIGQSSINLIHPGFIKGNHFHHQRWEKFMILAGQGVVKLKQKFTNKVLSFEASHFTHQLITIPPGYIHLIENTGKDNMLVWMWSSLVYDANHPDTYADKI
jgi:UDP-2-acetamido-2,6-beta-L-arabino-hexul-4-ose reductase